ncbi:MULTISPECIES: hypothetical protein [unclassified Anaeromyxobacter]|uniref:hypothetical protein n=1 Tax=unclassified Anaeromyxobacter TaxID=2620896 RepID=UPI001F59B4D6|nr:MULTISPECIES: hypothetical protein [unclassified Anaeromyxobacter]
MSDIPRAVLSEHLEERLAGRRVVSAIFTTYQLDPGFFEQHVLPVVLGVPVSHAAAVRLVQLEDALRTFRGEVAVYYDAEGLVTSSDFGPPRLDVRRVPVRLSTGVFHPKNLFLLVESEPDEGRRVAQSLLVGTLSANLTKSGWWSNVEVGHFEEIAEDDATRSKHELAWFLNRLRRWAKGHETHRAAQDTIEFLRATGARKHRTVGDRLHPHFYGGHESLADFLDATAGGKLRGAYLDVISPFFDNADSCAPLEELKRRFEPKEIRVFLPRSKAGAALCNEKLYAAVDALGATWARLPKETWLRQGRSDDAEPRYVHAKVYRFFTQSPKSELLLVGSVNLTRAAHQRGGNVESAFLVEVEPERRPESWLEPETRPPREFAPRDERADEGGATSGTRLQVRYFWDSGAAEAFWDGDAASPTLRLESRGMPLGELGPWPPRAWKPCAPDLARAIGAAVQDSSFVTIHGEGPSPGILLVQEEAMGSKPSLLLRLSIADILRYWSLLTPEQRAAFIEARAPTLALSQDGSALVAQARLEAAEDTLFDRFAGFFHGFARVERSIRDALGARNERQAEYLLFGRKYDSLGTLLDRLLATDVELDDVDRYVLLLCAEQLRRTVAREFPEFWRAHRPHVAALDELLQRVGEVRARLEAKSPKEMGEFLPWFDEWFLARAKPAEEVES